MKSSKALPRGSWLCPGVSSQACELQSQNDPGPRPGPPAAGSFFSTLNTDEQTLFNQAQLRFQEIDSVSGNIAAESGVGLGPTFNGNSCAQCHAQPTIGGSSPGLISPQNSIANPQVALATLDGAFNSVPSFITANGPVREARFIKNCERFARRRSARPLHHRRTFRCRRLQPWAAGLCRRHFPPTT